MRAPMFQHRITTEWPTNRVCDCDPTKYAPFEVAYRNTPDEEWCPVEQRFHLCRKCVLSHLKRTLKVELECCEYSMLEDNDEN